MAAVYKTVQGDTWDMVAKKVYGAERHLDYLMAHNFDLLDYFIFPAGIEINTPDLPLEQEEDLPAWRTMTAEDGEADGT